VRNTSAAFQPGTPFLEQRQALEALIADVQLGLGDRVVDSSRCASNLMQAEIKAYKVALGNYNNGFLAVQDHVKRVVGWELSCSNDKERACYRHAIKLVNRLGRHAIKLVNRLGHARWVPHVEKSGVPCPTCVGKELVHTVLNKFADRFFWTPRGADGDLVQAASSCHAREGDDQGEDGPPEEEETKLEQEPGRTKGKRGRKGASACFVDDRSPKNREYAEVAFARAVGFRVYLNGAWAAGGRVHTHSLPDGTLVEVRTPKLSLVPAFRTCDNPSA
jgi:hypothetical protein